MRRTKEYVGCLILGPSEQAAVVSEDGDNGAVLWSLPTALLMNRKKIEEEACDAVREQTGIHRMRIRGVFGTYESETMNDRRRVTLLAADTHQSWIESPNATRPAWWMDRQELETCLTDARSNPALAKFLQEISRIEDVRKVFKKGRLPVLTEVGVRLGRAS